MRLASLAFAILLCPGLALAQADPRASFKAEEQWILDVILSRPEKKAEFQRDWTNAPDKAAQDALVMRWRKQAAEFVSKFKTHLETTDIKPNAETVQKMVDEKEFAVANYWLPRQTPEKQAQVRAEVEKGNRALGAPFGIARGTVEGYVRERRKKFAQEIGDYLASDDVKMAMAYKPTLIAKAPKAIEQATEAARNGQDAKKGASPEDSKGKSGDTFAGGKDGTGAVVVPSAPSQESENAWKPSGDLTVNLDADALSDLKIEPPPAPLMDREAKATGGAFGVLFKTFGPTGIGIVGGGILGLLLGGPIGAIVGVALGAAAGYGVGRLID